MMKFGLRLLLAGAALSTACIEGSTPPPTSTPTATAHTGTGGDPEVPSTCAKATGAGTKHPAKVPTETWTAEASPHFIPFDTTIDGTLTLEPCAEVLIAGEKTVTVKGSIVANGSASRRVHIGGSDAGEPFAMIRTLGGTVKLSYTTVDGGGHPSNIAPDLTGMLHLSGTDQTKPSQETLFVDHVTLEGSRSNGVVLKEGAGFAQGSQNLTVRGSVGYPISTWARASGTVPAGVYTGNGTDAILLLGQGFVESTTLHDRGVPYHVGTVAGAFGDLRIEGPPGGAVSTLSIEPGVKLRFKKAGTLHVTYAIGDQPANAALIAVGTPDKPIVFTSAEASPAAGDWVGIRFGMVPLPTNKLEFVRVEHAGAHSGTQSASCRASGDDVANDAAIGIFGAPSSQFVKNTTIMSSAAHGIERGWRGEVIDFLPTNTFELVSRCNQTFPKGPNGACPADPPCPK